MQQTTDLRDLKYRLMALHFSELNSFKTSKRPLSASCNSGLTNADSKIDSFLGIPFALPPVDQRRLVEPQPFDFTGYKTFNADTWSPSCTSPVAAPRDADDTAVCDHLRHSSIGAHDGLQARRVTELSEDCLTLNIFRPERTSASARYSVVV